MLNQITLIGRLGKDPELTYAMSGTPVVKFSVATDDGFGEKKETTWHNVVAFNKTAEACAQYLSKGSVVAVVGRQTHRKYDDKSGNTKYFAEVVADRVQFISTNGDRDGANGPRAAAADSGGDIDPDSLPF